MSKVIAMMIVLCSALAELPALAQQTTGIVAGRIVDAQGAAVPGVTVTAPEHAHRFARVDMSDTKACTG